MSQDTFDPTDIYGHNAGVTLLPSAVSADKVNAKTVQFGDGSKITGVSQDQTANTYTSVPSSYALFQGLKSLQSNIDALDPNHNFFRDNTVITLPLIDQHFAEDEQTGWKIKNWGVYDGVAIYEGTGDNDNYLHIPQLCFTKAGFFHFNIIVTRLDSGSIVVYDHGDREVLRINKIGEFNVEMNVTEPNATTLRIVAEGVYTSDYVNIDSVGLHLVTDRFRDYFMNKLVENGLTPDIVNTARAIEIATTVANTITEPLVLAVNTFKDELAAHLSGVNPHDISPQLIKAATVDHTHSEFKLIGLDIDSMIEHVNNSHNPHGVTYEQSGAAKVDHTHLPVQCGAAPAAHKHDDLYLQLSAMDDINDLIKSAIAGTQGEISVLVNPLLVSRTKDLGVLPPASAGIELDNPAITFLFPYLLHMSTTDYDYETGLATCNRAIENKSAGYAFSDYFGLAAIFDNGKGAGMVPTVLTYRFHTKRKIKGYTLYKDPTGAALGFASQWEVSVKGTVLDSRTSATWSSAIAGTGQDSSSYAFILDVETDEITLTVNNVTVPSNLLWGVRISFVYSDVDTSIPNTGCVNIPISVNYVARAMQEVKENTPYTFSQIPELDTPRQLFLRRMTRANPTTGELEVYHTIQPDDTESIIGSVNSGVAMMMGKYPSTPSHVTWGTVTTNSIAAGKKIESIYSTGSDVFESADSSLVTITHDSTANTLSGITGFRFHWTEAMIAANQVPKSIRVTISGTFTDGTGTKVAGTKVALDIPELMVPVRADGPSDFWFEKFFPREDQFSDITLVKIELNYAGNRTGQTSVALDQLNIMLRGWWLNPSTFECSNSDRVPFGRIEQVALPVTSRLSVGLKHVGAPTGKVLRVPVSHFNVLAAGEYDIVNPFHSTRVETSTFSTQPETAVQEQLIGSDSTDQQTAYDAAYVTAVTPTKITVKVTRPGRYGLKVSRQW